MTDEQKPKRAKQFPLWVGVVSILLGLALLLAAGTGNAGAGVGILGRYVGILGAIFVSVAVGRRRKA